MEDYIFTEKRKYLFAKFFMGFIVVLILLIFSAILSYHSSDILYWKAKTLPAIFWSLFFYYLNSTLPLFIKLISPDKIIVSKNGLYVSYLKKTIPWQCVSSVEHSSLFNIFGVRVPIVAINLTNSSILKEKVPFFSSKFLLKDSNAINLSLETINDTENRNNMVLILNKYREMYKQNN